MSSTDPGSNPTRNIIDPLPKEFDIDCSVLEMTCRYIGPVKDTCTIPMHGHSGYYDSMWLHDSGPIKGTPWLYTTPLERFKPNQKKTSTELLDLVFVQMGHVKNGEKETFPGNPKKINAF